MKKVSSSPFFAKRLFPSLWLGFLFVFVAISLLATFFAETKPPFSFLIMPIIMAGIGFVFFKKLVFDLVYEVFDVGDALIVKCGKEKQKIFLKTL